MSAHASVNRAIDRSRDYYLFNTGKLTHSFLDPQKIFLPYLTLGSNFIPHMTLPSIWCTNIVNSELKRHFCPFVVQNELAALIFFHLYNNNITRDVL
jgi:hypothetical protein